jgi:hypothetical protein
MADGSSSVETLRSAGVPVDKLPDHVRQALSGLSPEEAQSLANVHSRIKSAGGEAASADGSGYFIY